MPVIEDDESFATEGLQYLTMTMLTMGRGRSNDKMWKTDGFQGDARKMKEDNESQDESHANNRNQWKGRQRKRYHECVFFVTPAH